MAMNYHDMEAFMREIDGIAEDATREEDSLPPAPAPPPLPRSTMIEFARQGRAEMDRYRGKIPSIPVGFEQHFSTTPLPLLKRSQYFSLGSPVYTLTKGVR